MNVLFSTLVAGELSGARKRHPQAIATAHEAYAVILEELDEFWDEVRKKRIERDPAQMLEELVQTAAMAQRAAEDLKLLPTGQ